MRKYSLLIVGMVCAFCSFNKASAQAFEQAKTALQNLYTYYDSSHFLTFDVKYTYSTDTVYGDSRFEERVGKYSMDGRKARFSMSGGHYFQNEKYFVSVQDEAQIILVTKPREAIGGNFMPMRAQIDSVLSSFAEHYTVSVQNNAASSKLGYVEFERADSLAPFDKFRIGFDTRLKRITSIEYVFKESLPPAGEVDPTAELAIDHKRTLKISFENYRHDEDQSGIFDHAQYFREDEGELKPVGKYAGYRIYDSR